MKVRIGEGIYNLEINNYFGPAYSYQSRTGEAIDFENDADAKLKFVMGALILNNDNFVMSFREMISTFDDESIGKAIAYTNERVAVLFADKAGDAEADSSGTEAKGAGAHKGGAKDGSDDEGADGQSEEERQQGED